MPMALILLCRLCGQTRFYHYSLSAGKLFCFLLTFGSRMKSLISLPALIAVLSLSCGPSGASAEVVGFTGTPTGNAAAWTSSVSGMGASINTSVNFDAHPTGALQVAYYASEGVILGFTGDVNTVVFGAGPGQGNNSSTPLSTGEGLHPASNYLRDNEGVSSFTINFAAPVLGVGLNVIDYFNPYGSNGLIIEAFDASNNSLGKFSSVAYNFQNNNMYFMGVSSSAGDISKLVFNDLSSNTGDVIGIDNIVFASRAANQVPEPGSMALIGAALAGAALSRRRKV